MSWTDVFPVLTDEHVDEYLANASIEETSLLDEWFGIDRMINPRSGSRLVATSLFWKSSDQSYPDLPPVTRELMQNAAEMGITSRFAPWEHYVLPLLKGAKLLRKEKPDVVFRVYLAADLEFLVEDLVEAGCEIALMKSSSVRHNPGAMWRFLAFEEKDRVVTIIDADRAESVVYDVDRTDLMEDTGHGLWRVPYYFARDVSSEKPTSYKPIYACQFGVRGGLMAAGQLMKAMIWHTMRGTMPDTCTVRKKNGIKISGTLWPDYGFDEWFLIAAAFPRLAFDGVLTFIPWNEREMNHWFALDIEYATWANANSEIIYIDAPKPEDVWQDAKSIDPWSDWQNPEPLKVRTGTTILMRRRRRIGPAHGIFDIRPAAETKAFPTIHGGLVAALRYARNESSRSWWVDLNPELRLSADGGEIFLDRRYEAVDVVFCGWFFVEIDAGIAAWAEKRGLMAAKWQAGGVLKVPKLEGPMTLWRTEFSNAFLAELECLPPGVRGEVLMKAWIEEGKAITAETTAKQMGWMVR